jgi:uncharacterized phage-associated protein
MRHSAPYDARQVTNFLIDVAAESKFALRSIRIQKLLYFCYGFFLIQTGNRLFHNPIEAWKNGPVVRSVWEEYRGVKGPISERANFFSYSQNMKVTAPANLQPEDAALVHSVFEDFRDLADWTLVDITHENGTAWNLVWNRPPGSANLANQIPDDMIRKEFVTRFRRSIRG